MGAIKLDKPIRKIYYYDMTYSVSVENGSVVIATTGTKDYYTEVASEVKRRATESNNIAQRFAEIIRYNIARANPPQPSTSQTASTSGDELLAQLERLGQLRAQGVLTEAEFVAAKAKLLGL